MAGCGRPGDRQPVRRTAARVVAARCIGFALPFLFDAGSFVVSAALIATSSWRPARSEARAERSWRAELIEGLRWLWRHELLRTMAIILGMLNASASITFSVYVLFAQEVLGRRPASSPRLMMGGAAGATSGGGRRRR